MNRFILASSSPRRIDLLRQVRMNPEVVPPNADETVKKGELPQALVKRLSAVKAESVLAQLPPSSETTFIIAADTVVVAPNGKTILGKPVDQTDAVKMLKTLVGRAHLVYTGYTVLQLRDGKIKKKTRVVKSRVQMRKISPQEIQNYVATGEPMDKAGSYAAQGIGMSLIQEIRGSYTNVVGLPMAQLLEDLDKEFGFSVF